jgi:hypothetical protein
VLTMGLVPLAVHCQQSEGPGFFSPVQPPPDMPIAFGDNNTLNFAQGTIKMTRAQQPDGTYKLTVTKKGKLIFIKDQVKAFTKVVFEEKYLMFSVLTSLNKDGANEGFGYLVNTRDNTTESYPRKLKNTCNPALVKGTVFFVDNLNLIKTDVNLQPKGELLVGYAGRDARPTNINAILGLSSIHNQLLVDFTPNRSKTKSKTYTGILNDMMDAVMLANEERKRPSK